jgi:DNA-binding NarL/FixJ family response regulator
MKILIIDNNKLFMESLFDFINSNFDIDIVGCSSDSEGVDYLESASRRDIKIDLLFIDVMDDELLNSRPLLIANEYKKSINPDLTIVLFSLTEITPLIQDAIDIGYVDYFLPKSISSAYLKLFITNNRFLKYSYV